MEKVVNKKVLSNPSPHIILQEAAKPAPDEDATKADLLTGTKALSPKSNNNNNNDNNNFRASDGLRLKGFGASKA